MTEETRSRTIITWRSILDGGLTVSMIFLAVTVVWALWRGGVPVQRTTARQEPAKSRPLPPLPATPVSIVDAILRGSNAAKTVLIEFSDFQCPYCGSFAKEALPTVEKEFVETGKIQIAFRSLPLEKIHPNAMQAAQALECANRQSRPWEMHDLLFEDRNQLDAVSIANKVKKLGLNAKQFSECMSTAAGAAVRRDMATAEALAVTGTPTFFVGSRQADGRVKVLYRIPGTMPVAQWTATLNKWTSQIEQEGASVVK